MQVPFTSCSASLECLSGISDRKVQGAFPQCGANPAAKKGAQEDNLPLPMFSISQLM